MKRTICVLLTVLLIATVFAGCGDTAPEPALSAQPSQTPVVTAETTPAPTPSVTPEPTSEPTPEPTLEPSPEPTAEPALEEFLTWEIEEVIPEDGSVAGTGRIRYPVYEGQQADALNRLVETVVFARKEEMRQSMRNAREEWELRTEQESAEWNVNYEETEEWSSSRYYDRNSGMDCFILSVSDYSFTGGAHGYYSTTYLVTDYASGEQVFLSALLRRFGTDLESAGEALIGVCEALAAEDSSVITVSEDYIRNELTRDGYWYPDEAGIHFIAPPYALSSYARGEVELVLTWDMLSSLPTVDSGIYDRGEDGTEPRLDVLCRDYSEVSLMELPVIAGTDSSAAQAINDELARLARTYYADVAENTELWQGVTEFFMTCRCYPCSTSRYLNILVTDETLMDSSYVSRSALYSWVYDREADRRVTLTDAMLMSGYHYDDFLTLLEGGMSQVSEYSLESVAFRMLPDGRPEFYLLVWWEVEEKEVFFSYSDYTVLRIDAGGWLSPCGELYLIDPAELDTGFTTGPLTCQAAG